MKNLFLLPTDKPTLDGSVNYVLKCIKNFKLNRQYNIGDILDELSLDFDSNYWEAQNIYITNSEEIKINEPYLGNDNNIYYLCEGGVNFNGKKIILTTDDQLIKDGVQAIDDEFLQWFVKNPSCESVELEKWTDYKFENDKEVVFFNHKIIIPKEEPKQDMKQTAVQWLEEQTRKPEWHSLKRGELFDQAKEMEKQQIVDAYETAMETDIYNTPLKVGKQYYKETFNK
jgi:hypothetical protein